MLRFQFYSRSFLDVDPDAVGLAEDSFERWLPTVVPRLASPADFEGFWKSGEQGAPTVCPFVLCAMLLLQSRYNVSDRELVARCQRDLGWKHALGLPADAVPPSVSSVVRFRRKLRERLGADWLHKRVLALAVADGLVDDADLQAVDSTNTDCRGAVIDTFNLIAVGIGRVVRVVARCLGVRAEEQARRWALSRYLARSVKGSARIDWNDKAARDRLLTEEIQDAARLESLVGELGVALPPEVDEALDLLRQVARQDVEELPDGTFTIRKGTAPGRVISITDPEARHGRKSSSKVIEGFKTHVLGTIESQFVTGIAISNASVHDAEPTVALLEQAAKHGIQPAEVLGDGAYGTGANRKACAELGTELHAKLPASSHPGSISKAAFDIDLDAMRVTCPEGVATERVTYVKDPGGGEEPVAKFHFDTAACSACARRHECCARTARGYNRTVILNAHEPELQKAKAFARSERGPELLRKRSAVERLIAHLVRMGMRHARFFGMYMVEFQAFLTAAAYNLQRYATVRARAARLQRLSAASA